MEEEKGMMEDNSELIPEVSEDEGLISEDINKGEIEQDQESPDIEDQEADKSDEIRYTNEVFMKGVVKFVKETKPTKKEVLVHTKLMPEELKKMEEVMEETHPKWYEEYIFSLRSEKAQIENNDDEKEEDNLALNKETKEIGVSEIVVPLRDIMRESENSGIIDLREEDRKREKGSFRTIKQRTEDGELNVEDILNSLIQEKDEKAVFSKYRITNKADIEEFYVLAMNEHYSKYKRVMGERYNTDFRVDIEGKTAIFILERPFEAPIIKRISINELLNFLIQTGEISGKDIRWLDYIRKKQVQIKPEDFIEILVTGKSIKEFYGEDNVKEATIQLKKCANILIEEGQENPKKMKSKNDTANFVNNLADPETEYEAALRLYAFIKKGGPIEKTGVEITLSQACINTVKMFGKDDKTSSVLLGDGITQLRILNKVQHLNEIQSPDGKVMKEKIKISENLKMSSGEKTQAKSTLGEALGDFNVEEFLSRGIIA